MTRARRIIRAPVGGHRRLNEWVGPPEQGFVQVASTLTAIVSSLAVEEAITLVRNRGMVSVHPDAFAADVNIVGAFGVGIVSAEAFAAGVGSMPSPYSDADWGGWSTWESFAFHLEFQSGVGVELQSVMINVDSKGMRKVSSNEVLVFLAESQEGAFRIADCTRQLFKLS